MAGNFILIQVKKKTGYFVDDGSMIYHNRKDGAVKLAKMLLDTIKEDK